MKYNRALPLPNKIGKFVDNISAKLPLELIKKILFVLSFLCFITGIGFGIYSNNTEITSATILEVNDKTVVMQTGKVNDDPIIVEITKDKHFNYQPGDNIYINKRNNHIFYKLTPEKKDNLNDIGINLTLLPLIAFCFVVLTIMVFYSIMFFLVLLPMTLIKVNKLYIIPIISFVIGLIILCLFANGDNANIWIAIGDTLILIPFLVACLLSIKKSKK